MIALADEIERDGSIASLSHAAAWRLAEARILEDQGRRTAALYLYGYVVEIRLVTAVLHIAGFTASELVSPRTIDEFRKAARENRLMGANPHDLAGWGRFIVFFRSNLGSKMDRQFRFDLQSKSAALYDHWRPRLRYKTVLPTAAHLKVVRNVVDWFEENRSRLWS
jgi:hypothetical protein